MYMSFVKQHTIKINTFSTQKFNDACRRESLEGGSLPQPTYRIPLIVALIESILFIIIFLNV